MKLSSENKMWFLLGSLITLNTIFLAGFIYFMTLALKC